MAEFAYRSWGLIPVDADPPSQALSSTHPPMMTAVAVDRGASLVFELAPHGGEVAVRLEATALSSEGHPAEAFEVYSGSADSFQAMPGVAWGKAIEGIAGVFTCRLSGVETHLKLRSIADHSLIVTAVHFGTP